jgi:hypothetical protein
MYLVGGFNHLEKYSSDWIIIPTIGKNKKNDPNHQPVYDVTVNHIYILIYV